MKQAERPCRLAFLRSRQSEIVAQQTPAESGTAPPHSMRDRGVGVVLPLRGAVRFRTDDLGRSLGILL